MFCESMKGEEWLLKYFYDQIFVTECASSCTAQFVLDMLGNHIAGFPMAPFDCSFVSRQCSCTEIAESNLRIHPRH